VTEVDLASTLVGYSPEVSNRRQTIKQIIAIQQMECYMSAGVRVNAQIWDSMPACMPTYKCA
jgi:hypothetical protein